MIAIIGGGRWARVVVSIVDDIAPPSTDITIHSKSNAVGMCDWVKSSRFRRNVTVLDSDPEYGRGGYEAAVVVNAAKNHAKAAEQAIRMKVPVLVEKPLTPLLRESRRLIGLSNRFDTQLCTSSPFRYASYIKNFAEVIGDGGVPNAVEIDWHDSAGEVRYGEAKSYDESLPVYADVLPHILAILSELSLLDRMVYQSCQVSRGGASVELQMEVSGVPCRVSMRRCAPARKRMVAVRSKVDSVLDFTVEPGVIDCGNGPYDGDEGWACRRGPMAALISDFLVCASSGQYSSRLNSRVYLDINRIIDAISEDYNRQVLAWLGNMKARAGDPFSLRYAVAEIKAQTESFANPGSSTGICDSSEGRALLAKLNSLLPDSPM